MPNKFEASVAIKATSTRPFDKSVYATDNAMVVGTIDSKKKPNPSKSETNGMTETNTKNGNTMKLHTKTKIGKPDTPKQFFNDFSSNDKP